MPCIIDIEKEERVQVFELQGDFVSSIQNRWRVGSCVTSTT